MIVLNKSLRIKTFPTNLMPGANTIPDDVWEEWKRTYPSIEIWLKPSIKYPQGELVEVPGSSIADKTVREAVQLVYECADPALIEEWRKGETRPDVLEAFAAIDAKVAAQRKATDEKRAALAAKKKS